MNKSHILLIEDDAWLAESYAGVLKKTYIVTIATNSEAALDLIDDTKFDLIIADVMLERGVVIDLLHELQSHPDTMDIPVVLCSSLASSINSDDVKKYGVVEVLDKSVMTLDDLRIATQRALNSQVI